MFRRDYIENEAFRFWKVCYEDLFLFALVALAIGLGTIPFGMGSALRMALPSESVSFENYERVGYCRFALISVSVVSA